MSNYNDDFPPSAYPAREVATFSTALILLITLIIWIIGAYGITTAHASVESLNFVSSMASFQNYYGNLQIQAYDNGDGEDDLNYAATAVTIDGLAYSGPIQGGPDLGLIAATTDNATTLANGELVQDYAGTFEITSGNNGNSQSGQVLLSGSFSGPISGAVCSGGHCTLTLASLPGDPVVFSNFVSAYDPELAAVLNLGIDGLYSITLGDVNQVDLSGTNIANFSGKILSGDFSADTAAPTPEAATWLMIGIGLMSMGYLGRRKVRQRGTVTV